ncbi:F0F1 ATP synthase subunit delta [Sporolactobacillus sp. THM7-7]|nr:F0F1 ATP synthase subunit delta [Sporolactobacillus sp. THM7-7]
MSEMVARRYAQALIEVAEERGMIDAFEEQLIDVRRTLAGNSELRRVLLHPQISGEEKKQLVNTLFSGRAGQEVLNLLKLLIDRKRESIIDEVLEAYTKLADVRRGILDVTVTTAAPLNDAEQNDLSRRLGSALEKKLRMHVNVDKGIIGGILLRIGNRLYDGTIKGKLEGFRHEIKVGK